MENRPNCVDCAAEKMCGRAGIKGLAALASSSLERYPQRGTHPQLQLLPLRQHGQEGVQIAVQLHKRSLGHVHK